MIGINHNRIKRSKSGIKIPLIDRKIYLYYNEYCESEIINYIRKSKKFTTFINIGAAYGEYLFFSAKNPNIRFIYGFEPVSYLHKVIKKIMDLNPQYSNKIKIYNYALGDKTGHVKLFIDLKAITSSGLFPSSLKKTDIVKIYKFDKLKLKIQPPILMLIDVENTETNVLKGAENFIEKYKPTIIIEVWEKNILEYRKFISKMNYKCVNIWKNRKSDTQNWKLIPLS